MFAGSPLNRLAWLRPSSAFLNAVVALPATRWLLFNSGQPLVAVDSQKSSVQTLAFLSTSDVEAFLGQEPYFGQGKDEGSQSTEPSEGDLAQSPTAAARHFHSRLVFLGVHEPSSGTNALPSSDFAAPEAAIVHLEGTPYFSADIADLNFGTDRVNSILDSSSLVRGGQTLGWSEPRVMMSGLDSFSGGVFAEARSLVDWNQRNKASHIFLPLVELKLTARQAVLPGLWLRYILDVGWLEACMLLFITMGRQRGSKAMPIKPHSKGLHNFCHPRTDPVVIMLVIDESGEKALLGRGKRFPPRFYSALAGFVEPGETFEDAVVREIWEEVGAKVRNIKYHSGQPWPYPANLMVGFYMRADASHVIRTDLDNELTDAQWYTRQDVLAVLGPEFVGKPSDTNLDHFQAAQDQPTSDMATPAVDTQFTLPPSTTLAGAMIRDWVQGKLEL